MHILCTSLCAWRAQATFVEEHSLALVMHDIYKRRHKKQIVARMAQRVLDKISRVG
eukprot:COSAG01_NODE_2125_length_8369_cov_17.028174_2_plen_56_part_00